MIEKQELRTKLLGKRGMLADAQIQDYSDGIIKKLIAYINWGEIENINTYQTIKSKNEVDVSPLLDFLNHKYPNIKIDITDNKITSAQNMPADENYDLVIVPLLGFDRTANRLGYGGGYYDRFLAKNNCRLSVGLAYSFQEVDNLPTEAHDQKLDLIITEKEIIEP